VAIPPLVISLTLQVATGMNCGVSGDDKSLDGVAVTQHDKYICLKKPVYPSNILK
jgi:hypothetical protein